MSRIDQLRAQATAEFDQGAAAIREEILKWPAGVMLGMSALLANPELLRTASHGTLVRVAAPKSVLAFARSRARISGSGIVTPLVQHRSDGGHVFVQGLPGSRRRAGVD